MSIKGMKPSITSSFVAPSATVAGNVQIGGNSAVWYGAILRGQGHALTIGESSSVGDLSVISSLSANTHIGSNVSIGTGVSITDSVVGDNTVLGDGVKLLRNSKVESQAMVASGSVVATGTVVPTGQVWGGSPASYLRDLSSSELHALQHTHCETLQLSVLHASEAAKSWEAIEREEFDYENVVDRNSEYYQQLSNEELSKSLGEVEGHMVPGRIFDSPGGLRVCMGVYC
ncbi:hypothetical protein EON65_24835 [archaeon]|nr:MAG: hypothetical protein EON65_24835 [archaeon]